MSSQARLAFEPRNESGEPQRISNEIPPPPTSWRPRPSLRPGLVHIISAYVAQYAALDESNARQLLRAGIVRGADPGLCEHELFAYYYDRVDQPEVAHGSE